jgi:hypothetical protein
MKRNMRKLRITVSFYTIIVGIPHSIYVTCSAVNGDLSKATFLRVCELSVRGDS